MSKDKTKDAVEEEARGKKDAKESRKEQALKKAAAKYAGEKDGEDKKPERDFSYYPEPRAELAALRRPHPRRGIRPRGSRVRAPQVLRDRRVQPRRVVHDPRGRPLRPRLLKNQPKDNKSNMTPTEQLAAIFGALPALVERHEKGLAEVEELLGQHGLVRVSPADYTEEDRARRTCEPAAEDSPAQSRGSRRLHQKVRRAHVGLVRVSPDDARSNSRGEKAEEVAARVENRAH